MNPSSDIENGHKTRLASDLEDMVFLLTHLNVSGYVTKSWKIVFHRARHYRNMLHILSGSPRRKSTQYKCWVLRDMQQNRDSDFSVVRDIIGICYLSILVHPGWSPCNRVAGYSRIYNKIVCFLVAKNVWLVMPNVVRTKKWYTRR